MKNVLADMWMQLSGVGIVILAIVMFLTPFIVSLVTNIGRRAPNSVRAAASRRMIAAPRRAIS